MGQPETAGSFEADALDLTNCDREPIHIPGRVQSFGALISVTPDWIINHKSRNAVDMLGLAEQKLVGAPLTSVFTVNAIHPIRTRLQMIASTDAVDRIFGLQLTNDGALFDVAVHQSGRAIIFEFEKSDTEERRELTGYIQPMIARITDSETVTSLCNQAARQIKALSGMDRVMVYKFLPDGSGKVIAEARAQDMQPFLGLTYPASDIPKQARVLYTRNLLRVIGDTADEGFEIVPTLNPDGEPLDLSMSTTRAVSPVHLEYLRNMGVQASMSVSILRRGKLWGLFACHHNSPMVPSYPLRTAIELFALLFSYALEQKHADIERLDMIRAQTLHDQIMAQLAEDSSIGENFDTIVAAVRHVVPYDGVVGWMDGQNSSHGAVPSEEEFMALMPFLNTTAARQVYASHCLSDRFPAALDYAERAAGLLVLPVSRTPRDYIVLFRREIAKTVKWAGNPDKSVEGGQFGARLTPRKSFDAWQQTVRNQCAEWTPEQIRAADALRVTLMEVVLRMSDVNLRDRARAQEQQEQQELLIAELNHRVRNILNLIKGVVSQSAEGHADVASFTKVIGGRIHALALAHDQITKENWEPSSLYALIETEAAAYLGDKAGRLVVSGPDALLQTSAFSTLSLVIHEMMTNSVKYGALAHHNGQVHVTLVEEPDAALVIKWDEVGGPPVQAPTRRGFGTTIIERSIPYELSGKAELKFAVAGVEARFMVPQNAVHAFVKPGRPNVAAVEDEKPDQPNLGSVLIVEDNIIISLDAEFLMETLGADNIALAPNVDQAMDLIGVERFDFALLDVNLGNETSLAIADRLNAQGVRFAFATGYGELSDLKDKYPGVPIVNKPYNVAALSNAIKAAGA